MLVMFISCGTSTVSGGLAKVEAIAGQCSGGGESHGVAEVGDGSAVMLNKFLEMS